MKVPELSIEGWAKVVGATSATIALAITLWKALATPVKQAVRNRFDRAVVTTLTRNKKLIRAAIQEEILQEEFTRFEEALATVDANSDRLTMVESALTAQGVALSELPKIAGQMEGLPRAIETLSNAMREMSENVGFIRGKVEERERWDGQERRQEERPVQHNRRRG